VNRRAKRGPGFRERWRGRICVSFSPARPSFRPSFGGEARSIMVAHASARAAEPTSVMPKRVRDIARAESYSASSDADPTPEPSGDDAQSPTPVPTPAPTPPPRPSRRFRRSRSAHRRHRHRSWYGPGFYATAPRAVRPTPPRSSGRASPRSLRHARLLQYRGRTMTVPVIDRGPYIAGRTLDLSHATHVAIGCPDLCTLSSASAMSVPRPSA